MSWPLDDLFSADAGAFRPNAIRAFAKLMNDPAIISFAGGMPNPETFPVEAIAGIAARVIRDRRSESLQYGPTPGLARLREIVTEITRGRGIECKVEESLISSGSQQALSLISQVLLDPGDIVLVELPTYIGATSSFYARRAEMVGVQQDDEGIVPESLRANVTRLRAAGRRVKFLYTIPNFQNPSGRLMTQQRRKEVLEIAKEHHFLILEDDPYGELVYTDAVDTTPIKAHDEDGQVLYLSTFSKTLSPGLRCGWIIGARPLIERLEIAKQSADLCSAMLDEVIVEEFCSAGLLEPQIARVRAFYRERRATLIGALEGTFRGHATWTPGWGGLFTFLTLNDDIDTAAAVPRAVAGGVAYVPGSPFFVDGSGRNTMRLTFAKEGDERMREGVHRLARIFLEGEG